MMDLLREIIKMRETVLPRLKRWGLEKDAHNETTISLVHK